MATIRGDSLRPEMAVRAAAMKMGLAFTANDRTLPGTPDLALRNRRIAVFVDGCFWHRCPRCFRAPRTRRRWWLKKINANVRRDRRADRALRRMGWAVWRIREHEL
jgi:DNA mismatch endonuclease (patch repair protein)